MKDYLPQLKHTSITERMCRVKRFNRRGFKSYGVLSDVFMDSQELPEANDCFKPDADKQKARKNSCCWLQELITTSMSDRLFRRQVYYSCCLFLSFLIVGLSLAQGGATFMDLQLITCVSTETASYYMTSLAAGCMIGSLISGAIYNLLNKFLLMWIFLIGLCLSSVLIPWCRNYVLMLCVQLIVGVFLGSIDTVCCAEMVAIWNKKNGKTSMQALHLGFALGGIISPLVTAPFLETERRHLSHSLSQYRDSRNDSFAHRSSEMNLSFFNRTLTPFPIPFYRNLTTECDTYYNTSVVYISYAISAGLAFVVSVPFIIIYFRMQDEFDRNVDEDKERPLEPLPVTVKVIILFNMSALSAIYTCLEETFVEFLSTFCVSHLKWTKVDGSIAISLFFWSVAAGQFVNAFIVRYVDQVKLIGTYSFVLILVLIEMTFSAANHFHVAVWISPSLVGLSLSIIYPIIFTWTEDVFMPVTGRISSLFILTGAMGSMINPTILGVLMEQYSPMWYCYLLLIESIMLFVFCISGFVMHRFTKTRFPNKRDEPRGILKP